MQAQHVYPVLAWVSVNRGKHSREQYATRLMQEKRELPDVGEPVHVALDWFPERRRWNAATPAASRHEVRGLLLDGKVWLQEGVLSFRRIEDSDAVLRVEANGKAWYCDKAK